MDLCCYANGKELKVSEAQKTCDVFHDMITALMQAAHHRNTLRECIYRDAREIAKLNDIIDELRDERDMLRAEIKRLKGGEA